MLMFWFSGTNGQKMTEDNLSKCLRNGTLKSALATVKKQLPQFVWHQFLKRRQSSAYENHKQVTQDGDSITCLLQMDFAKNYTVTFQDEIQSAHWRQAAVSIHCYGLASGHCYFESHCVRFA